MIGWRWSVAWPCVAALSCVRASGAIDGEGRCTIEDEAVLMQVRVHANTPTGGRSSYGYPDWLNGTDWYSRTLELFPPAEGTEDMINFGLATTPLHPCAAGIPAGGTTSIWPHNQTTSANMYATLMSTAGLSRERWSRASVLEVGSGRGGGSALLARCFCPAEMVGMDINPAEIRNSQARLSRSGGCPVRFVQGDAQNMPFADHSYDVVVNVESSHMYPRFDLFLAEVKRILRPGGSFLMADMRKSQQFFALEQTLERVFERTVLPVDISRSVSLSIEENRRVQPYMSACRERTANAVESFLFCSVMQSSLADVVGSLRKGIRSYRMYCLATPEGGNATEVSTLG